MTKRITVLQQDDCAPDSYEWFEIEFEKMFDISFKDWKKKATREIIDEGYGFKFTLDGIEAYQDAGDPWWTVSKIIV